MENLLVVAGTSLVKYAAYLYISQRPSYQYVATISELYLYPVKSCQGIKVNSLRCTTLGVEYDGMYDRHWVFATKDGMWITQRQEPRMALIEISIHGNNIHFDAPGMTTLTLPKDPHKNQYKVKKVQVKLDIIDSLDCGNEAASWINKFLGRNDLCLHYSPQDMEKRDAVNAKKMWSHDAKPGDLTAFSDYCSYMILSQSGLDDLNNRLAQPVTCINFRANIIVKGCPAYDEDNWDDIKIQNATFRNIDACTRCILTTVDPFKGEKSKDEEPLKTLKTYRAKAPYPASKPCFGIHLANDKEDVVHVGDQIYATRK